MFTLTLVYTDGSQWIAGGFPSMDAANAWVAQAQKQADWDPATQVQIVDNTPPPAPGP